MLPKLYFSEKFKYTIHLNSFGIILNFYFLNKLLFFLTKGFPIGFDLPPVLF